ncbi:MAG: M23 family metallopeptidase [Anaerolineales bacterium]|nr:M23 family metallopeptidase [Anaerolineales bacterium]MCX7754668.1 M23 family metallopeptidase [Anaerolineales bacterium]MDW8278330.1 hypothetical protein [Anaerolineales bacterium]
MSNPKVIVLLLAVGMVTGLVWYGYREVRTAGARGLTVGAFLRDPASQAALMMRAGTRCGDAPFVFPTDGLIGFLWDDSFRPGHRHAGIDIFAGTAPGVTPVYAAYPGYLTRQADWKSSLIVRVPSDPLWPGRQIWVYYTHLAGPNGESYIVSDFPPGTRERYIETGTLLGYQGNYSGTPGAPVGVHLHISVVKDDGFGNFKNELDIENTYDPSPYFGLELNANRKPEGIPICGQLP